MSNKTNILTKWQLEKRIPLGIIIAILLQTLTAIWWAAKLDSRVVMQEEWFQKNQHLAEKGLARDFFVFYRRALSPFGRHRLEERIISLHEELECLEARISHGK